MPSSACAGHAPGRRRALLALLLGLGVPPARTRAQADLLEPEQAFRLRARMLGDALIELEYTIAPGYYLYRDKFRFRVEPRALSLGEPVFAPGVWHEDAFFGRSEIYRDSVTIRLPLRGEAPARAVRVIAVSQGCADIGVCFLPIEQIVRPGALPGLGWTG